MQIYLARNNQQAGPYTIEQLNQMLESQQVLLTDLAWHQGMTEWKTLGELTQGQLVYTPVGYIAPSTPTLEKNDQNNTIQKIRVETKAPQELASFGSRIFAKFLDILLWLPAAAIPSFFLKPDQITQLNALQQKMQSSANSNQMVQYQQDLLNLIPVEAWQSVFFYIVIMLAVQAFFLAKTGQSLGKKIAKIKIVDANTGEKVNLTRIFLVRSVIFIFLNMVFMPFITIIDHVFAFSSKRQTLHDKLAKTKVIKQ
ncbi:RDD family protein [Acinetobacter piscicola]|uniref:RDD family protein n=1 Tax=Acinetobacter piscicola TaxID=2006115 RepID=UPI000B7F6DA7|nr:RDD family protein [Acinetobacter piscicola]